MKSALIITSIICDAIRLNKSVLTAPYDMIICCDAGIDRAKELGIAPDLLISDFDSSKTVTAEDAAADDTEVVVLPHKKDMTDT